MERVPVFLLLLQILGHSGQGHGNSYSKPGFHGRRSLFSGSRSASAGSHSAFPLLHYSSLSSSHPVISPWLLSGRTSRIQRALKPPHAKQKSDESAKTGSKQRVARDGAEPGPLRGWPQVYLKLQENGLKAVTGPEALEMMKKKGAVLVDVRKENEFEAETMEGAVNVPMFKPLEGNTFNDNVEKLLAAALGVKPTRRNPNFGTLAKERLPSNKPLIVACNRGGRLDTERTNSFGTAKVYSDTDQYTLSMKAAFELYQLGFKEIYFLKGGFVNWRYDGLPVLGPVGVE